MLPWAEMMRTAAALGLSPNEFWACAIREWIWLTVVRSPALDRVSLDALAQRFPDAEGD